MAERHTIVVTSALARSELELTAAREAAHGRQLMRPAQLASRLAGGFRQPVQRDALLDALRDVLAESSNDLGALRDLASLPGTARAAAATLHKAWAAGLDLAALEAKTGSQRLAEMAALEAAVLRRLPASMLRAADLVAEAQARIGFAPKVIGPITLHGVPDLDPVWRPLVVDLASVVPVTWRLGQFDAPAWLTGSGVEITRSDALTPTVGRVSCANPRHEALESIRWARALVASGEARPEQIALVAPTTHEWDEHLAAIAADANLPLALLHGQPALSTRDGQAAAALADVLLSGLGQARVRRAMSLLRGMTPATRALPSDWYQILPADAPLLDEARWEQAIAATTDWPGGEPFADPLRAILRLLAGGADAAAEAGETLLSARALGIWRKALREGPAGALDVTLAGIRIEDDVDPCTAVVWCSAADGAASPRPHVRLLGLTSRGWPRARVEDPLLPAHVVEPTLLDPVPVAERDDRDFHTLLRATPVTIVLSRSRREGSGRQSGESALPRQSGFGDERALRRERVPEHAASEADRLLARADEFGRSDRARRAVGCWDNWHVRALTPHDGVIRAGHPVLARVVAERYSATRLRMLARDPLGFLWRYALGWKAAEEDEEPLVLDALAFGALLHRVLELAVRNPAMAGGIGMAAGDVVRAAIARAAEQARAEFEASSPVPPRLLWQRTLDEACTMAEKALRWDEPPLPDQRSYAEVAFGSELEEEGRDAPWDAATPVTIPGTDLAIGGRIDRIDIAGDRSAARVTDYKSGREAKRGTEVFGGKELQRCLYAYAARAMLGPDVTIETRLLYTRDAGLLLDLDDAEGVLRQVTGYLVAARDLARAGLTVVGPDSAARDDEPLTFALPANAKHVYLEAKGPLADARLAPLPELWELP